MPPFWAPCPPSQISFPSSLKRRSWPLCWSLPLHRAMGLWNLNCSSSVSRTTTVSWSNLHWRSCDRPPLFLSAFTHQLHFDLLFFFKISRSSSKVTPLKKTPLFSIPGSHHDVSAQACTGYNCDTFSENDFSVNFMMSKLWTPKVDSSVLDLT